MKIYLAGKYSDRENLGKKRDQLISKGHKITHDWMTFELPSRSHEHLGIYAKNDIQGVIDADLLLIIMDDKKYTYRGSFTELGAGLALNKRILIVAPDGEYYFKTNCFWHHPSIHYVKTWDQALGYISMIGNK